MITKITINNFKKLNKISFEFSNSVVIIGPNNGGKTTIFQALCLWEIGVKSYLQAKQRKTLTKNNTESGVSSLQGTIKNIGVTGVNYLSPVPLEVLAGSYKNPLGDEVLSINQNPLHISPVFNISFDFGQGLQVITEYTYDPTMYLLSFNNSAADNYVLMLGTGEGKGLACYVVGSGNPIENTVLYTIPSGQ